MGLAKRAEKSVGFEPINRPKVQLTSPVVLRENEDSTVDEIFIGLSEEGFTHNEALEFMEVSESEFLELLVESGNCPSGKLDKNRIYPTELIFEIDPGKWEDPKVYTLDEIYGDVANNTYSLEEALEILKISKSKFKERSLDRGFCTTKEFDNIDEFPFEWVWYIDNYY